MSDHATDKIHHAVVNSCNSTAEAMSSDDQARYADLERSLKEYEQRKRQEVIDSAPLRRQRKAARAEFEIKPPKRPTLSLSPEGDTLLLDGEAYYIYYAYGSLKIDPEFKRALRKNRYSSEVRREILENVEKLVAESPSASKIYGAP